MREIVPMTPRVTTSQPSDDAVTAYPIGSTIVMGGQLYVVTSQGPVTSFYVKLEQEDNPAMLLTGVEAGVRRREYESSTPPGQQPSTPSTPAASAMSTAGLTRFRGCRKKPQDLPLFKVTKVPRTIWSLMETLQFQKISYRKF